MNQADILLCFIKPVLSGILVFSATILWTKKRTTPWTIFLIGVFTAFSAVIYEVLTDCGILFAYNKNTILIAGVPLITLLFTIIPPIFFLIFFVLMIKKSHR
ncbi:MAG: hypothetical protein R3Y36_02125 [Spirochaetales bacterium]